MIYLGAHAEGVGKGLGADGNNHELLEVSGVGCVLAAVQDIEHGDGQQGLGARVQVTIKRQRGVCRGSVGRSQRYPEHGVGPEPRLAQCPIQIDQRGVKGRLVQGRHSVEQLRDLTLDVAHGFQDTLSAKAGGVAIA